MFFYRISSLILGGRLVPAAMLLLFIGIFFPALCTFSPLFSYVSVFYMVRGKPPFVPYRYVSVYGYGTWIEHGIIVNGYGEPLSSAEDYSY